MSTLEIEAALVSPDVEVRRDAVLLVGRARDAAFASHLMHALGDADWRVREEAVRVVTDVAVEFRLLSQLIAAISQGGNVGLRNAAREVLQGLGAAAAHALVAALPQVEESARKFLVDALACGGADEAVDTLVTAVRGDDPMLAVSAMDALTHIGGPKVEAVLREKLVSGDAFERAGALDAVEQLAIGVPFEELAPLLCDRVLRRVALAALGRSGDPRALPYLVSALRDRSPHVLARALVGLERLLAHGADLLQPLLRALETLTPEAWQRVRECARDEDVSVVRAAAVILGLARDADAVPAALWAITRGVSVAEAVTAFDAWAEEAMHAALRLSAADPAERALALELAFALSGRAQALAADGALAPAALASLRSALRGALHDQDPAVRMASLRPLARFAEAEDVAALVAEVEQGFDELAVSAGAALRELSRREPAVVRQALAKVQVAGPAAATLAELLVDLDGNEALPRLRSALLSDEPEARASALVGLARLGSEPALELVCLALTDEATEVQVAAVDALSRMGNGAARAVDVLLGFESQDPDVQAALARALASLHDPRALPRLRKLARVGPPFVRLFAIEGLSALADPGLAELLVEALGDSDHEVVKQALTGLGQAGGARAAARVAIALDHPAWDVRRLAAAQLGRIGDRSSVSALRARLEVEPDSLVRAVIGEALAALPEAR